MLQAVGQTVGCWVCVYVLTHTIAALVTVIVVIVVEGDCNGRVVMEEVVMEAVVMEGDHRGSTSIHVFRTCTTTRASMDLDMS